MSLSGLSPLTYATDALLVAEFPRNPRHIATFYLWDASVNGYCPQVWETRELWHHRMLYASVRDAILLEKNLMSVCPQWSKARKFIHPFLAKYQATHHNSITIAVRSLERLYYFSSLMLILIFIDTPIFFSGSPSFLASRHRFD